MTSMGKGFWAVVMIVVVVITFTFFHKNKSDSPQSAKTNHALKKKVSSDASQSKQTAIQPTLNHQSVSLSSKDADLYLEIALYRNPEGTKRYQLKKNNHDRLLECQQELVKYFQMLKDGTPGYLPTSPAVRSWAMTLYKDALATRLEEQSLSNEEREKIQEVLQSAEPDIDLSQLQKSSSHLPERYLSRLRKLLAVVFERDTQSVTRVNATAVVAEISDLIKRRKRYSNNYFQTNIKHYLTDPSISMQKKIALLQYVLEMQDQSLIRYTTGYFLEAERSGALSAEESKLLSNLWRSYDVKN